MESKNIIGYFRHNSKGKNILNVEIAYFPTFCLFLHRIRTRNPERFHREKSCKYNNVKFSSMT